MDSSLKNKIFQWDVDNWYSATNNWHQEIKNSKGLDCLAIGEREGGLSLWIALNGGNVICSDYNKFEKVPLDLHSNEDFSGSISYKPIDVTNIDCESNQFDLVIFKSVVGSLGNKELQVKAFKEIHRVLKPGGKLVFAENLQATRLHKFAREKFTNWGHRWYYPTIKEIEGYTDAFSSFEYQTRGFLATFGRSESQRKFLNRFDKFGERVTPKSWHYIISGIATK